jgi:hypothetical protein
VSGSASPALEASASEKPTGEAPDIDIDIDADADADAGARFGATGYANAAQQPVPRPRAIPPFDADGSGAPAAPVKLDPFAPVTLAAAVTPDRLVFRSGPVGRDGVSFAVLVSGLWVLLAAVGAAGVLAGTSAGSTARLAGEITVAVIVVALALVGAWLARPSVVADQWQVRVRVGLRSSRVAWGTVTGIEAIFDVAGTEGHLVLHTTDRLVPLPATRRSVGKLSAIHGQLETLRSRTGSFARR